MQEGDMRIIIAEFLQETNSFSPVTCGLDSFKKNRLALGTDIYEAVLGKRTELNGFIDTLQAADAEIIPAVSANTVSSGPVEKAAFDYVLKTIKKAHALHGPADGILLALHGAMLTPEEEDATGSFLAAIRELVGKRTVIACTFDFHANVTRKMVQQADILVGYNTYPHVDLYETGCKAAALLLKTVKGEINPTTGLCRLPMILPAEACMTSCFPTKAIMDMVGDVGRKKGVVSASVFIMQPWLNVSDVGCSTVVITNGDSELAKKCANVIADKMWELKEKFSVDIMPLDVAFQLAAQKKTEKPVVFADSADSPSAGATGDSNAVLRYMLENKIDMPVLMNIVDSETAFKAKEIGQGNTGSFEIGGKLDTNHFQPVAASAEIMFVGEWQFSFKGPMYTGKRCPMGQTAILKIENSVVVVMENPVDNSDPEVYRSLGLDLNSFNVVVVKSANGFRSPYAGLFEDAYIIDTPGASNANLKNLSFDRITPPVYPFHQTDHIHPVASVICRNA
jgi:microcystin degradation protein MlrC